MFLINAVCCHRLGKQYGFSKASSMLQRLVSTWNQQMLPVILSGRDENCQSMLAVQVLCLRTLFLVSGIVSRDELANHATSIRPWVSHNVWCMGSVSWRAVVSLLIAWILWWEYRGWFEKPILANDGVGVGVGKIAFVDENWCTLCCCDVRLIT